MTSLAKVLEKRLLEAGPNLLKLGAIIGEFGIDQSNVEIDTPKQARQLIIKHIEFIKGQQSDHTKILENRTSRLLDCLREERRHQISCTTLFKDAADELHLQSNLIKCSLQLQSSDYEADMIKRKLSLEKGDLRILITGEICAGKSSVMNMLMGGYYLPVGHGPCTRIPCEVKQSKDKKAALHYADTRFSTREVTIDTNEKNQVWKQLRDCVETGKDMLHETEQRTNKQLKKIVLYWNFPFLTIYAALFHNLNCLQPMSIETLKKISLKDNHQTHVKYEADAKTESEDSEKIINGVTFVDAPGIHDTDQTFTSIHEYIEDSDGFLFIINTSQHAGIDRDRLVRLMSDARTIFQRKNGIFTPRCALFACNKWDLVDTDKKISLQKEILNKLQACWSRVAEKQIVPCNGSVQVLNSIQQADYSDEYISFYKQICSFIETATRTKTETHCWWLSNLMERTLAITISMQNVCQKSDVNKEKVLEQLQRDINAVEKAKETMDALDKRLIENLNGNLKMIQNCIQTMLKNDKPSLAVWHITNIPRQGTDENWLHLSYTINETIGRKIEKHILKNTQLDLIRSQCSTAVDSGLNEVIKVYAKLESQLTFKREIRDERLADLVGLMSESASDLTWEEIAGVIVAVVFPLAPILILFLGAIDTVKTQTMLNDEGLFQEDCYLYMKLQTEIIINNILASQLQQVSEALLDGQLRNCKFVLKYFRSCLDIQHQLLKELLNEISSSKSEERRIEQIQQLSDRILQLLISDILCPDLDKHTVCFDNCERNCIGNGSFGNVYIGKLLGDMQETDVAIKVIKWPKGQRKCPDDTYIYRECFNLRMLSVKPEAFRKNVVEFYGEFVEISSTDYLLHIVMELCHESLDSLIKKDMLALPWCSYRVIDFPGKKQTYIYGISYVTHLAEQAAMGIQFLHHNNVVHRDIKPHNFLIKYVKNDAIVKICDFGMSREQTLIKSVRCVGTPLYNAPEVLAREINTFESDIYSFGLVIWELWYGKRVYEDLSKAEICHPRRKMPNITDIRPPKLLEELMVLMWHKKKKDRPDASSVVDKLKQLKKRYGRDQTDLTETAL